MRTLFIGIAALVVLRAQAPAPEPAKETQAIIDVKYADVNELTSVLQTMFGGGPGFAVRPEPRLHVLVVRGSPDQVAGATAAVKKLDVPTPSEPDVELTVYLISGLAQGQSADEIPPELGSTVKQLHGLFSFKGYRLTDTLVLRGRAVPQGTNNPYGDTVSEGVLPGAMNLRYRLAYRNLNVFPGTPHLVHINGLNFRISGPKTTQTRAENVVEDLTNIPASITTDLDLREGQKTVIGKSSVNSAGDALILVIVPKVMD